jgi:holliday junction DNA helicase RuvA
MISFLRGTVVAVDEGEVTLDVGGVGLAVSCSSRTASAQRVGETATLLTALVVREDAWTIFGFSDSADRQAFALLQSVTGVGPRLAQAVLSALTAGELQQAVAREDLPALMRIPGVGRRLAQRLALELHDRLPEASASEDRKAALARVPAAAQTAVVDGLVALGWSQREAAAAAAQVVGGIGDGQPADVAALLRAALRSLDRS